MAANRVILDTYKHKPGGSCMVTALSGIYRYNGLDYSPEQIIGLGSGLHFAYGYDHIKKNYRIEFISSQLFYSLLSNTGVFGEEYELGDNKEALDKLLQLLDSGMPVPVLLNPLYCEGLMKRTPKKFIPYIPSHMVVVYGYDLEKQEVYLYDSPQFNTITMPFEKLIEGRHSGFTNPANKHYEFYFPKQTFPYEVASKLAIQRVVNVYKYSERHLGHRSGIQAVQRFSGSIRNWRNIFTDNEIIDNAKLFLMSVTNGHATKSGFRTQYSIFLKNLSERVSGAGFYESADAYNNLGKLWIQFQDYLSALILNPCNHEIWKENSNFFELIKEIEEKEIQAIHVLDKNLNLN